MAPTKIGFVSVGIIRNKPRQELYLPVIHPLVPYVGYKEETKKRRGEERKYQLKHQIIIQRAMSELNTPRYAHILYQFLMPILIFVVPVQIQIIDTIRVYLLLHGEINSNILMLNVLKL